MLAKVATAWEHAPVALQALISQLACVALTLYLVGVREWGHRSGAGEPDCRSRRASAADVALGGAWRE